MSARFGVQLNVPVGFVELLFNIVKFPEGIPLFQLIVIVEFPELHEGPLLVTKNVLDPNVPELGFPDVSVALP